MLRPLRSPYLLRMWLMLLPALAPAAVFAQDGYRVRGIDFEGNETLSDDDLASQMYTQATSWFSEKILQNEPFLYSRQALKDDIASLVRYYQTEGFLDVSIEEPVLDADPGGNTVSILIKIVEGDPILVDSIRATFITPDSLLNGSDIPPWDELREDLELAPEVRFRDDLLAADRSSILSALMNRGYAFAHVQHELKVDRAARRVSVKWEIWPGPVARFGDISLSGDIPVSDEYIRDKVTFGSGDAFNESKMNETQLRIYGLSLFNAVKVKADLSDTLNANVPIEIEMQEAKRLQFRFGIGYGRESRLRFTADLTWRQLFRGPGRLTLDIRRSALEPYAVSGSYVHPDILLPEMTMIIYPYASRNTEPSYVGSRRGVRFAFDKPLFFRISGSVSYALEKMELDTSSVAVAPINNNLESEYVKSSLSVGFERNTARPFFDPSGGSYIGVTGTFSGKGFKSRYQFEKYIVEGRQYFGLSSDLVLASRIKGGAIVSHEADGFVPVEERFYSGGSTSIRGWRRFELGPLDPFGKPIGGNSLLELNAELRYPIWGVLSGVLFAEAGNVWIESWTYRLSELGTAIGAGLRISTPIGPIRLDGALPLSGERKSGTFFFSVGHAF